MSYYGLDRPSAASSDSPFAIADKAFHDKSNPQAPRMVTPRPRGTPSPQPPPQQHHQQQAYTMSPHAYSHAPPQAYAQPAPPLPQQNYAPPAPPHPGLRPTAMNAYMGASSSPSPPPWDGRQASQPPTTISPYAIGGYPSHPPPPPPHQGTYAPGPSTSASYHPPPSNNNNPRPYPVQEQQRPSPVSRTGGSGGQPSHLSPSPAAYDHQPRPPSSASAHTAGSRSSQIQDDELWQMFSAMDIDRSGTLSAREVQSLLGKDNRWKIEPREDCVKMLMNIFDTDRSGSINFVEFEGLYRYIKDWHAIFHRFDKDRSGTIDRRELEQALQSFGYPLPIDLVKKLEKRYAPPKSTESGPAPRGITFDRFLMACVTVKHFTEAFRKRDLRNEGRLTLDYSSFMELVLDAP